jgi:hypothetical protein
MPIRTMASPNVSSDVASSRNRKILMSILGSSAGSGLSEGFTFLHVVADASA